MNTQTLGVIAAGLGLLATVVYIVLGREGVRTLKDIRDHLRSTRGR